MTTKNEENENLMRHTLELAVAMSLDDMKGGVRVDVTCPETSPLLIAPTLGADLFITRIGAHYTPHYGNNKRYAYGYLKKVH